MQRLLLICALAAAAALPARASDDGWPDLSKAPRSTSEDLASDAALIISIGDYDHLPDVPGAKTNGDAWAAFLRARGAVVKQLSDGDATREEMEDAAAIIRGRRRTGGSIWLVFIGHGAPGDGGGALVGADARSTASSLEKRAIGQSDLLELLGSGEGIPVIAVIDACFSGTSQGGRLTRDALQPVRPVTVKAESTSTLLVAARGDQYAGSLPGLDQPAFSWLTLGALRGWGDRDGNGAVTAQEALDFSADRMAELVTGRRQEPEGTGHLSRTLGKAREKKPDLIAISEASLTPVAIPTRPLEPAIDPAPAPVGVPAAVTREPQSSRTEDLLSQTFDSIPTNELDSRVDLIPCGVSLRVSSDWHLSKSFAEKRANPTKAVTQTWSAAADVLAVTLTCAPLALDLNTWHRRARDALPSSYQVYSELGHGLTTFGGVPAAWISYDATPVGGKVRYQCYLVLAPRGRSGLVGGLCLRPETAERYWPLGRAAFDSIRLD
jgi:hypothetical protein